MSVFTYSQLDNDRRWVRGEVLRRKVEDDLIASGKLTWKGARYKQIARMKAFGEHMTRSYYKKLRAEIRAQETQEIAA